MEAHQKCPVCLDIPEKEIYQCAGGHTICHICIEKLEVCPECREPYGTKKIRNRILEQILDNQTFDCPHVEGDCKEKLKRQDISKHAKICLQQPISICKLLGYKKCNFKVHPSDSKIIIEHFKKLHAAQIRPTNKVCLWHANFKGVTKASKDRDWNPILLTVDTKWCKDSIFLITGFIDTERRAASWRCIKICGNVGPNYEAEFTLLDEAANIPCFKWTLPVSNLNSQAQQFGVKYVEILLSEIKTLLGKTSKIPIFVVIQPSDLFEKRKTLKKPVEVWTYSSDSKLVDRPKALEKNDEEVHSTAECSYCEQSPIFGKRHKCLQCDYYDLCEECMALGIHHYHIFATITTTKQGQILDGVFPQIRNQLELASMAAEVCES